MSKPPMPRAERAAFIRDTKDLAIPFFSVVQEEATRDGRQKYTSLSRRQYHAFMDEYRGVGSEDSKISFGFRVVGNLMSQVPIAYSEHLKTSGEYANLAEVKNTLISGYNGLVGSVAKLDRDRASRYETWLGMRNGSDPLGSPTPYRFLRWQGALLFEPKIDNLDEIDEEIAEHNRNEEQAAGPERGCPALKFILPELWGINVNGCVMDRSYFAADIANLAGSTSSRVQ